MDKQNAPAEDKPWHAQPLNWLLGVALGAVIVMSLAAIAPWHLLDSPRAEPLAAWVQAIGSVGAIAVAVFLLQAQHRLEMRRAAAADAAAELREIRSAAVLLRQILLATRALRKRFALWNVAFTTNELGRFKTIHAALMLIDRSLITDDRVFTGLVATIAQVQLFVDALTESQFLEKNYRASEVHYLVDEPLRSCHAISVTTLRTIPFPVRRAAAAANRSLKF